jgi:hypothetical protein
VGAAGLAALVVVGLFVLLGSGETSEAAAQTDLKAAGCTFKDYPGVSRKHISDPAARPKQWNSFPPTSGPHYVTPAVYGLYPEPVELARVLHGLEHGGISMLYGPQSPPETATKLREIYEQDPRGLVVAPLPELGKKIALGAWTSDDPGSAQVGTGHLATCTQVDTEAYEKFIDAFRGRGPEGVPLNLLQPGGT